MKRLDRFILKAFAGPFVAILFVVLFILVMQFLWLYIDELVGKGLGMKVILEFLMWGSCTILPMAMPLATLLASVMTMGQLADNNELIALKAAGISVTRVMAPLIIAAAAISVGAFFTSNDLIPHAYNQIYTLREDILKTKEEIKIPAGTFYDGIDGYILRVDKTDEETGMMQGVLVYDHTKGKGNTSMSIADSAIIRMAKTKDYLTFTMYNGTNYQETNSLRYRDTSLELQKINFTKQEMIISLENYAFEKSDSVRFGDQVKSMNVKQLSHMKDSLHQVDTDTHRDQFKRLMSGGYFVRRDQLDSGFVDRGLQLYENPEFLSWQDITKERDAYQSASTRLNQMISDVTGFERESYEYTFYLRRADLEFLKKFAGALACFILFFIGAPIGALVRKGGLGVPMIVAVLFFGLYWVIDLTGAKLAKDGAITADMGAFISTAILFPLGIWFTWKAVNDSNLFNVDTFKSSWRSFKSKIMSMFKKTRIVYMGTPDFAVAPLDKLIKGGYNVVGVVTVADKPSGRGLKLNESAVKKYAVEHNIPVLQPVKLKDPEFLEALKAWKADLFVVVAFRMLPEEVWTMPKLGTFNLHAALLPQYRGAAPLNWAVINGEQMTGVTTFMIDKDIDTGGIILRQDHRIAETDTVGDVHDALMEIGSDLVVQTVQGIIEGNVETRVQRSFIQGSEVLKPAPKLTRELCHIDWTDTTKHVYDLIRGLSPYPAAFTELVREGENPLQLKIFGAEKLTAADIASIFGVDTAAAGTVLCDGKSHLAVATADGAILIKDLQLSGKKRMDVKSFLLGFREPASYSTTAGTSKEVCAKVRS